MNSDTNYNNDNIILNEEYDNIELLIHIDTIYQNYLNYINIFNQYYDIINNINQNNIINTPPLNGIINNNINMIPFILNNNEDFGDIPELNPFNNIITNHNDNINE